MRNTLAFAKKNINFLLPASILIGVLFLTPWYIFTSEYLIHTNPTEYITATSFLQKRVEFSQQGRLAVK